MPPGCWGTAISASTAALPPLRAGYEALFLLFDYTRNGLFFPPVFLLLGGWLALRPARRSAAWYGAGLLLSLALLTAEGLLVQRLALARFDALYLSLPLCVGFLLRWLQRLSLPSAPALRDWAAAVYVLHPWCIVLIRGGAGVVGLTGLLVDNCLVHYLAVVLLSSLLALPFARIRPAPSPRSRAWIELNAAALRHNLAALGSLLPAGASLMPVIKANAYGHGDLEIARLCAGAGADAFAVATAAEGVRLRRGGVRGTILVLGYSGPELAPLLARYRLTQTVVSTEHARALDACGRRLAVHLKVDTGLHRLGIPWDDTQSLTAPYSCSHLRVTGVFTHLADTERLDEASQARTREQLRRFRAAVDGLRSAGHAPETVHFQGSYGLLNYPGLPCGCARPGIALYGVLSAPGDATTAVLPLRPVLSLRAEGIQLHTLAAGEAAGYDGAYTAHRPTVLATLSIGYADGWPRTLSNGAGRVLLHGRTAPEWVRILYGSTSGGRDGYGRRRPRRYRHSHWPGRGRRPYRRGGRPGGGYHHQRAALPLPRPPAGTGGVSLKNEPQTQASEARFLFLFLRPGVLFGLSHGPAHLFGGAGAGGLGLALGGRGLAPAGGLIPRPGGAVGPQETALAVEPIGSSRSVRWRASSTSGRFWGFHCISARWRALSWGCGGHRPAAWCGDQRPV